MRTNTFQKVTLHLISGLVHLKDTHSYISSTLGYLYKFINKTNRNTQRKKEHFCE